jgi:hypothetical protein
MLHVIKLCLVVLVGVLVTGAIHRNVFEVSSVANGGQQNVNENKRGGPGKISRRAHRRREARRKTARKPAREASLPNKKP